MDEQRAWIKSRRRKRLRITAVALCVCLLVTVRPDILETFSTFASEWKDSTVYVSGFAELPEEVREQTVPLGTGVEELSLPDTLEAFAETPEEEGKPGDEDKPGDGNGDTENPGVGEGGTENPSDGEGGTENPGVGEGGTENPGEGTGGSENPGEGTGSGSGDAGTPGEGNDGGSGDSGTPGGGNGDSGTSGEENDGGNGDSGNPGEGADGGSSDSGTSGEGSDGGSSDSGNSGEGSDGGSGDSDTPDGGNSGEGEPETHSDSAPADGAAAADEMAKESDGALTVQCGVFVMPVYLSEPVDTMEPQTMERKAESIMIKNVTWQAEPAYNGDTAGTYLFAAVLPDGYAPEEGVNLPQITVTVQGEDPVVQELLARIAALPDAEEYLAGEPDVAEKEAYETWMDGLSAYTAEAFALWEMYETLSEEQRAQIPTEALEKLAAWVELAGRLAEDSMVMAAADGWQAIENSNLKWKLEGTTLKISGTGEMPDWTDNTVPWKDQRKSMTNAVIEDGVSNIGEFAFYSCALDSVSIPNSVTSIHQYAFWSSTITSVTIPNSMTSIEQYSFQGCDSLKSVKIPESVTSIGVNAFNGCDALASVEIPENVTSIGYHAFGYCTALTGVKFKGTATIPTLNKSFEGSPCADDGVKGISIPTCKYLTVKGWSEYKDHVSMPHTLIHTAEKPATCEATGTKEYWTCSGCSTKFSDAAGTTVITAPVTIPATGHNLAYKASGQTIVESCSNGCGHSSQAGFTLKDAVTEPYTYTGSELKPFIITCKGSWLGTMPSISYKNNVNAGTATVFLSIDSVRAEKTFIIDQKDISDDSVTVSLSTNSPTYTGSAITPAAIVDDGSRRLKADTDYMVSYKNNTEVGPATITLTGTGNYTGTRTEKFTIGKKFLSSSDVVATLDTDSLQYTGQALKPTVTEVTANGRTLTVGTDYTVSYNNNINAGGNAQVIITGTGSYTGTCTKTFTITAKPLTDAMVTLNSVSYPYAGSAITPDVLVKNGSKTLTKGTDYTVSCQNNTAASTTAKVTITGTGNYTGTLTKTFTITPKSLADVTVRLNPDSYPYTGEPIVPMMTVTDGSRTLTAGTDYTVKYENNTAIGTNTAKVILTGMGNYTGTRTETFSIGKQSLSSAEVTLDAVSYPYIGQAVEPMVTKVILGGRTLTADTDYTVSYQNNTNASENAQVTIMGKDGYTGECIKKFTITPRSLTDAAVTAMMISDSYQYNGTGIDPTVTVSDSAIGSGGSELVKGRDYTVSCRNNKDVSTDTNKAQVILTGTGNYTGTLTETFTIVPKSLADSSVTVTLPADSYQYTGKAIEPAVTVSDSAIGGTALVENTDYTVAYADNTAVGTNMAKVTVTGTGNYTGARTLTFTIQDKAPEVSGDNLDLSGGTVKLPDDIKDKVDNGEVEIYDSNGNKITPNPDGSLPVEPGTTIKIKYPGSNQETEIQIPPRPAAPAPVDKKEIEKTDTTIKVPVPDDGKTYEFVLVEKGTDPDWSQSNTAGEFTGLDPNKEYDLYMRKQATEDSFASEPVKTEIRTSVTVKEPETGGAGADKPGNDVSGGKPGADGSSVTYTGTCEKGSTPVIIVDGKEITPDITWDADGEKGTWSYTVPVKDGDSEVGIRVEFKDRGYTGLEIEPGSLDIYADNAANRSADTLLDYLKAHCTVKAVYDNGTSDDATAGADYKVNRDHDAKGAEYEYTVEANADTGKVTLTVNPVNAAVEAPDALTRTKQPGGYSKAEVDAWLPAEVTVTYTGAGGYAQRTKSAPVTWKTDALGADFGASAGSKSISGTVALPEWATGGNTVSIGITFADRSILTDDQMNLSISGWSYGAQAAPAPRGSVTVTDTEQTYTYRYRAGNSTAWLAAGDLPKSASGNIIPGDYQVEMTYAGRSYTGTKTAAFAVVPKPVTAEKGTLSVETRRYDGTTKATLKAGGKPALSGVVGKDDVSLGGTLKAVFTNKGPKKDIPVTVTGFALTGSDAGYYKLINTTLTLRATINNKDGSSPSSGSSGSGNSGNNGGGNSGSNTGGSTGNSSSNGSTGTGGSTGTSANKGGTGGTTGIGGNKGGIGGSTGIGGNKGGTGGATGTGSSKGSVGSGSSTGGTGKGTATGTGKGSTAGAGKGTSGTGKGSTSKGTIGNGSGSTVGNDGTGGISTGDAESGGIDGTGRGSGNGSSDAGNTGGTQAESVTVQTVQAAADDGRIVIPDGTEAPVAIGTLTEDAPGATRLMVGEGTVTVTVVCGDDQYTVGMNDATAVANAVLTPEQIRLVDSGESLEIRVDIKNIAQSIPEQDRETVEKGYEAYGKYLSELKRGGYVDISVYMKTGEGGWNAVSETSEPMEVVIGIPEDLLGEGREYYVIRAHEGRYSLLNDMDDVPETITIVTDMFSSYAIAFREAKDAGAGNGETAYGQSRISPNFLRIVCFILVIAAAAGIVIVVIVKHRRKREKRAA